jgi:geranylgeranyl pyrophosphate synthase
LLGLDEAKALSIQLRDEALAALDGLPQSEHLHALAHYIVERTA